MKEHNGRVCALAVLKNGDLISGSADNTIKIWNAGDWTVKQTIKGHSDRLRNFLVHDDKELISASADRVNISVWNINDGSLIKTFYGHTDVVRELVLLKNGDLASASDDKTIKIWNIKNGT